MFPAPVLAADDEAEMRALFGITEDSDGTDTNVATNGSSAADETTNTTPPEENTSDSNTATANSEDKTDATATNTDQNLAINQNSAKDTLPNPEEKFNKQNSAFAQMRIQNKEFSDLLMNLAQATGQKPKNIAEATDILRGGLTKVVSKNRNIPEDVLREMEEDKRRLAEFEQTQARQKALAGFQAVKDAFTLSREDVNNFADKLIENNLNPFEQNLDLVKEYKNLYFDELIAKAKEQGVQEERARSLKAQNNSTTPGTQKGLPENTGSQAKPIKSVTDLNSLLDSLV